MDPPDETLEILCAGDIETLYRPCVDCGQITGCYCDFCLGKDRHPSDVWADGQRTPLCTRCDAKHGQCHYCRGIQWATPHPHGRSHIDIIRAQQQQQQQHPGMSREERDEWKEVAALRRDAGWSEASIAAWGSRRSNTSKK